MNYSYNVGFPRPEHFSSFYWILKCNEWILNLATNDLPVINLPDEFTMWWIYHTIDLPNMSSQW